ncbi:MAG: UDP-N-acetylmuramoyl-L-alanyl-D-glutamate--2,6-diaminopimelate ligase [Phycisphaerae bacterium]
MFVATLLFLYKIMQMKMNLETLIEIVCSDNPPDICFDSRLVKNGDCFVAVKGTKSDGHNFIDSVIQAGAKYIVCQSDNKSVIAAQSAIPFVIVPDTSKTLSVLTQARYGYPARKLINLAVTGTKGKTTVTFLVRSVIENAGNKCGLIGTVVCDTYANRSAAVMTTPDSLQIAKMQNEMVHNHIKYMVIEASSHALSQNRLSAIDFSAAAFTNLSGDHLDYHVTEENYLAAKTILFENLSSDSFAVLNKQSPHSLKIASKTKAKILWYGIEAQADIIAEDIRADSKHTEFIIKYGSDKARINTPLLGRHNISNHLAAAGLCLAVGFDLQTVADGLSALKLVPGRLEKIDFDGDFTVLIDYAHTDDALKNVLMTLKPLCKGKLRVLFGCGGDRDRTKRPRMAAVAEQLADFIVVSSDNPRSENPKAIIDEIVTGFKNPSSSNIITEPDREKAIKMIIESAGKDDIVLIAGKGHETYQIIGDKTIDFSDIEIARKYLCR